jgi:hypothetical protein
LLLTTSSLAIVGIRRWQAAVPMIVASRPSIAGVPRIVDGALDDSLDAAERVIATLDPFRLANASSTVRFNSADGVVQSTAVLIAAPLRPTLVLKAIVGGPPWHAVIDGIPGQPPGTVVRAGTVVDKLTVAVVNRDTVIIRGPDTTWTLSFRSHP